MTDREKHHQLVAMRSMLAAIADAPLDLIARHDGINGLTPEVIRDFLNAQEFPPDVYVDAIQVEAESHGFPFPFIPPPPEARL